MKLPFSVNSGSPTGVILGRLVRPLKFAYLSPAFAICHALAMSSSPKIVPTIISTVAVNMVVMFGDLYSSPLSHHAVHGNRCPVWRESTISPRVPEPSVFGFLFLGKPLPLHEKLVVDGINSGRLSLGQFYNTRRCIHRLILSGSVCFRDDRPAVPLIRPNEY